MRKSLLAAGAAISALAVSLPAHAALLNAPVPVNATLSFNGLQWAWAAPLDQSNVDLSYQSQFGWRLPTAAELLLAPTAQQFIYAGANTPFGGTDPVSGANWAYTDGQQGYGALAAPYFSSYSHGDFCNGPGSGCVNINNELPWNTGAYYAESLVVRALQGGVPEPATWAMMIMGLGLTGFAMRRRQKVAVRFAV